MWFSLLFLLAAVWGLTILAIALFNPMGLVAKFYRFDKRMSRIGPLKVGAFYFSEDPAVHRVFMAGIGALLAVGGTAIFVSLV